jgi:DNA mismatch repair ATPase MutL
LQALRADGDGGTEQEAQAASELERRFNKKDFKGMTIHGQFNKGFIMASSGRELFIIDQHASDEKYNFERLQDTLVLNKCASGDTRLTVLGSVTSTLPSITQLLIGHTSFCASRKFMHLQAGLSFSWFTVHLIQSLRLVDAGSH